MQKLRGLISAAFTPFDCGRINTAIIPDYARYLVANGVAGVFVNGTTGEGHSLTLEERLALAKAWVEAAPPELKVIIHVGHNSLPDCCEMSRHAQECGAWAVSALAPNFFKPSLPELVEFVAEIAAAAPRLPFYYYNMPSMTGLQFRMVDFLNAAESRIPNLAGIKFTFEDLMDYSLSAEYGDGRYDLVFGRDEILLCAATLGARAAIGSTYNFAAPLYTEIFRAVETGDLERARELQLISMKVVAACVRASSRGLPAIRALTEWRSGFDLGAMRAPISPLAAEPLGTLIQEVEALAGPHLSHREQNSMDRRPLADGLAKGS